MDWIKEIPVVFTVIIGLSVLLSAIKIISSVIKAVSDWIHSPSREALKEVKANWEVSASDRNELRSILVDVQQSLNRAYEILSNDKNQFKIVFETLWVMLEYAITNGDVQKLIEVRDKLQAHLIQNNM